MKVQLLGSSTGTRHGFHYLTSFLIDDVVAIDAGSLGIHGTPGDQEHVRDVIITHTHLDHVATLPVFIENSFAPHRDAVRIHGAPETLRTLKRDMFNDRLWPDLEILAPPDRPFFRLTALKTEVPTKIAHLSVTAVEVNHHQPSHGFIVSDGHSTIVISSDTGPTERIWELAASDPLLRAVFIECSFPDREGELAEITRHLTPSLLYREIEKLGRSPAVIAYHLKPRYLEAIIPDLRQLSAKGVIVGAADETYVF